MSVRRSGDAELAYTLSVRELGVTFGRGPKAFRAVDNVSLQIAPGEVLGLVGESGSGKSTLARAVVGLHEPSAGEVLLDDQVVSHAKGQAARHRRRIQMIFQDPSSCLDPRLLIGRSVEEAVAAAARREGRAAPGTGERRARVRELLDSVGLPESFVDRLPRELSGGQRQRVAIARAVAAEPQVILADEITSALDVSVQGAVLNHLLGVQRELGFSMLFISHNLAVVRLVCDRVAVMRAGKVVESGPVLDVLERPSHAYTKKLIAAVPNLVTPPH